MADRNRHIRDLTEGPLIPAIIRFIVPIITMNLLQNLYNAADMMIVGLSDVPGAIGSNYSYPISWAITTVLSFAAGEMALRRMSREAAQPEKEEERS